MPVAERVRAAEMIAALCLATDLGMGLPFEHGFHSTLVAMRIADRLGVDPETASQTYYACLLMYAGCTADAEIAAELFQGSMATHFVPSLFGSRRQLISGITRSIADPDRARPVRVLQVAGRLPKAARTSTAHVTALCEVAEMLTERLGLPRDVQSLFPLLTERWDGKSQLGRAAGEAIPLPLRITHVARDAAVQSLMGGEDRARQVIRERAGHAFDPEIAMLFVAEAESLLAPSSVESAWDETLACEPSRTAFSKVGRSSGHWRRSVTSLISFLHTWSAIPRASRILRRRRRPDATSSRARLPRSDGRRWSTTSDESPFQRGSGRSPVP